MILFSGLTLPDIISVAQAYKIKAVRINDVSELELKIREALDFPGPVICDVMVIPALRLRQKLRPKERKTAQWFPNRLRISGRF